MEEAMKQLVVARGHLVEDVALGRLHIAEKRLSELSLRGWASRVETSEAHIRRIDDLLIKLASQTTSKPTSGEET